MDLATLLIGLSLLASAEPAQPVDWAVAPHTAGGGGRVLFSPDPVLLRLADGAEATMRAKARADENGKVAHPFLRSGWALSEYESDDARTVIVEARGHHSFFVNGERFGGDIYRSGILRVPVPLREGTNRILVRAVRGEFTFRLFAAEGACSLSPKDALVPDLRPGTLIEAPGAALVLNHTGETLSDAFLEVGDGRVFERATVSAGSILPYSFRKAPFPLRQLRQPEDEELDAKGNYPLPVTLLRGKVRETISIPVPVRKPGDSYVETRISGIDGSVQYHAVRPPVAVEPGRKYGLFLSLHGAGVEARGQARAYRNKRDAFVIAPTNRRKFGFDWQEWGRLDALEVLEYALTNYPVDPARVYLTGHSMGGHGTWYLGTLYASRFAAIAPSAGWASFFTYGGGMPRRFGSDPDLLPFEWAQTESDTLEFVTNLTHTPVYILHGEKDDNVPASEAHRFVRRLSEFHPDFTYHEQPGAGHWWGNDCVDWIPLFEFCRRHIRVEDPLRFTFATPNPAVSSRYAWLTIHQQIRQGRPSRVVVEADPRKNTVRVRTENVASVEMDLGGVIPGELAKIDIDGTMLDESTWRPFRIHRDDASDGSWHHLDRRHGLKGPKRSGPFKLAFTNRMVWVYGTTGTPEENAATLAKVRYDSQVWWFRSSGSVTIVGDRDFDHDRYLDRNVILYGNRDTNSAYARLLADCPVEIRRGAVHVGEREYAGDLGLFLVYPKSGSEETLVGVVGSTTARNARMSQEARYFVSGAAVPDWAVWSEDALHVGMPGVAASGWFTNDWRLADPREDPTALPMERKR